MIPLSPPFAQAAAMPTLAELIAVQSRRQPEATALQWLGGTLSYRALAGRVDALAAALHAQGLRKGDRVAVLSENCPEYVVVLLACARLGLICACLNWRMSDREQQQCLALVAPRAAFVSRKFEAATPLFGAVAVHRFEDGHAAIGSPQDGAPPVVDVGPEDGLYILFTSGTTGQSKGALISHRALVARGILGIVDGVFQTGRTQITWGPMFHQLGTDYTLMTLAFGGKVILFDGPQLDPLCDALATETNLGWLGLTPGMVDEVLERLRARDLRPLGMDSVGCMADLIPRARIAEITQLFNAPFRNTFGLTEAGSAPASAHLIPVGVAPADLDKVESTFARVRLVDEAGHDVADGEPGELLLRSPTLFSGYWNMPQATADAFRDGWYCTGDVFVRRPSGRLAYVDRKKYLIKSGGENIYPAEIEQILRGHPAVAEVVVVRRSDARWGEVPVAFVERRDPAVTEAELIAFCRGKIAGYKLPKGVRFLGAQDMPRNVTGKVMRKPLERLLEQDQG
ncbi:class I adenylate-forming enzyme family protein [Pseudorhodoferax sp.]|uniref:class I adenylate-forming enzyme family protein n=1 Tax=Pseudorhodoferax sp. TaxID=1993553 RepID=UPI002DD630EA|nr:class I adenylate-forming enzyme family protein [Pseudorhodoferax sp.]